MSQDDLPITLDDAPIKEAVRAAWGQGSASTDLRRRVLMAMTRTVLEESIPETVPSRRFWDRWPAPVRVAAGIAALLVVAIGVSWGIIEYESRPAYVRPGPNYVTPTLQPSLYALLVSRHDDFNAGSEAVEHLPTPDRITAVREALAGQIGHSVWVPDLVKLGWKLSGVRVYPVNGVTAIAFNFERGADEISAFSIPASTFADECLGGGFTDIDLLVDNRAFAGFGLDGQLFALVGSRGSGPFPQPELRALVSQFRDDPACRAGCVIAP